MGELDEVAAGVYRLGTDWVGFYLLVEEGRVTLVDCGFAGYHDQVPAALGSLRMELDALEAIVLTHYHADHVGSAERLRDESGASVHGPREELDGIQGGKVPMPDGIVANLWRPVMWRYLGHAIANSGMSFEAVEEVEGYSDGDVLEVPGGRLRVIETPGHSRGHCSLLAVDRDVLFAGDALGTRGMISGTDGPQLPPFNEDAERARASLSNLEGVEASVVCFGHGDPFQGTPDEAVAAARSRLRS